MTDVITHDMRAASPRVPRGRRVPLARLIEGLTPLVLLLGSIGCNRDQLPPNVADPALTQTPTGARQAYYGTLALFRAAFGGKNVANTATADQGSLVAQSGLLADELAVQINGFLSGDFLSVDQRALPEGQGAKTDITYSALQKPRGQAQQAIGLLTDFLPDPPALRGHLGAGVDARGSAVRHRARPGGRQRRVRPASRGGPWAGVPGPR